MLWSELIERDPVRAEAEAVAILNTNPDDEAALFYLGQALCALDKAGVAVAVMGKCAEASDRPQVWNNYGMALSACGRHTEAKEAFMVAYRKAPDSMNMANIALCCFAERETDAALHWADRALAMDPGNKSARNTKALALLSKGKWADGWDCYQVSLGGKFRKHIQYSDEPMWDGSPGKDVVFYGEQGLGDEIMYASCLPDAIKVCRSVMVECDPRLQGLFRRSFQAHVYGTRTAENITWLDNHAMQASMPVGALPRLYRRSTSDCPKAPYLVADPERRLQWRALFDSWGKKPKVGIAWSGGSRFNNPQARSAGLEAFRPLIERGDADWISLQYIDPSEEIAKSKLPVRHFARATLTDDYDDTAALVAELDYVISVPTTVVHLAGALGVKTTCICMPEAAWMHHCGLPFYGSVSQVWKNKGESWPDLVKRLGVPWQ